MFGKLLTTVLQILPITGQTNAFVSTAMNVTNCTNPINASVSAIKLIVDVCAPPQVKYPIKCLVLVSQLALCLGSGGTSSVITTATTIAAARQILEEL
jgi:hypothetical protein